MDEEKKISLVIPVYNEAPFLERCLDSVVKQRSPQLEVIIIDDGSTDGSGEICDKYEKRGFRIFHIANGGVSRARNFGIDQASGKWVTFLDADDEWVGGALTAMLSESNSEYDIIGFNQLEHKNNVRKYRFYNKAGIYGLRRLPRQYCMVWDKMYRKKFLEKKKLRFWEGISFGEDEIFNLECLFVAEKIKQCRPAVVLRHFDNQESLVRSLSDLELRKERLVAQDNALRKLAKSQKGLKRRIVEGEINRHYRAKLYRGLVKEGVFPRDLSERPIE